MGINGHFLLDAPCNEVSRKKKQIAKRSKIDGGTTQNSEIPLYGSYSGLPNHVIRKCLSEAALKIAVTALCSEGPMFRRSYV